MWLHQYGTPGNVVAQLMGHAKVDTTLKFSIVQFLEGANGSIH